ncbi:MAG: hypothetical protein KTR14_01685, partial [Vampirovibrio sp.]|nr:hypothetical protein [Vampirovibrio sp.]
MIPSFITDNYTLALTFLAVFVLLVSAGRCQPSRYTFGLLCLPIFVTLLSFFLPLTPYTGMLAATFNWGLLLTWLVDRFLL